MRASLTERKTKHDDVFNSSGLRVKRDLTLLLEVCNRDTVLLPFCILPYEVCMRLLLSNSENMFIE